MDDDRRQNRQRSAEQIKKKLQTEQGQEDVIAMALAEFFVGQEELRAEIQGLNAAITDATAAMREYAQAVEKNRISFT